MRAVNLLPRDTPTRSFEAKRGVVFAGTGGVALLTVAFAALLVGAGGSIGESRQALDQLNAELLTIPKPVVDQGSADDDAALAAEKAKRIGALSTALAGRVAWDGVLRQISLVLPSDVWLTSLTTAGPALGATGGGSMTISGSTYSHAGVARFLSRIAVLPALSNVQLQTSTSSGDEGSRTVQFTIVAGVKAPGASA